MKRKRIAYIAAALSLVFMTACGSGNEAAGTRLKNTGAGVEDVLQERMEEEDETAAALTAGQDEEPPAEEAEETEETAAASESGDTEDTPAEGGAAEAEVVDVDLTVMSSTMVYSEVYNMMNSPDDYLGRKIKMKGLFSTYHDETTDKTYYACIIQDATACCAQGIEFEPEGDFDVPEEGSEICVSGVFDTYYEGEYKYCTLRLASLVDG